MRIPNKVQLMQPWRIHSLVADFRLEDVWALRALCGGRDDFDRVIAMAARSDPTHANSAPARLLWGVRDRLGKWFSLGRISTGASAEEPLPITDTHDYSLAERLSDELRDSAKDVHFDKLPFVPLYRTEHEFAAEVSNRTVHGVMHLAWVKGDGGYHAQMAVYVKPRGWLGQAYMAFIKPFRYWIVYPALERQLERAWSHRQAAQ